MWISIVDKDDSAVNELLVILSIDDYNTRVYNESDLRDLISRRAVPIKFLNNKRIIEQALRKLLIYKILIKRVK